LTLVELDDFMVEILNDRIKRKELEVDKTEFTLLHQDVLKFEPKYEKYSVVANIPYYITSPILQKFLYESAHKPENMIILMQKEV
jgi:16S rRNA (adenine1518-N6/adenine1519-N6)-dimethyltransferase